MFSSKQVRNQAKHFSSFSRKTNQGAKNTLFLKEEEYCKWLWSHLQNSFMQILRGSHWRHQHTTIIIIIKVRMDHLRSILRAYKMPWHRWCVSLCPIRKTCGTSWPQLISIKGKQADLTKTVKILLLILYITLSAKLSVWHIQTAWRCVLQRRARFSHPKQSDAETHFLVPASIQIPHRLFIEAKGNCFLILPTLNPPQCYGFYTLIA